MAVYISDAMKNNTGSLEILLQSSVKKLQFAVKDYCKVYENIFFIPKKNPKASPVWLTQEINSNLNLLYLKHTLILNCMYDVTQVMKHYYAAQKKGQVTTNAKY